MHWYGTLLNVRVQVCRDPRPPPKLVSHTSDHVGGSHRALPSRPPPGAGKTCKYPPVHRIENEFSGFRRMHFSGELFRFTLAELDHELKMSPFRICSRCEAKQQMRFGGEVDSIYHSLKRSSRLRYGLVVLLSFPPALSSMGTSENAYRRHLIVGVTIFCEILGPMSFGLRIWARRISKAELWWDDYVMSLGLVISLLSPSPTVRKLTIRIASSSLQFLEYAISLVSIPRSSCGL